MSGPAVTPVAAPVLPPALDRGAGRRARRLARRNPGVSVGPGAAVGRGVRVHLGPGAALRLEAAARIGPGTVLRVRSGELLLGPGVQIGEGCTFDVRSAVRIGAGTRVGDQVLFTDWDPGHADPELPLRRQAPVVDAVTVGARARIGTRARVLRGVHVGDEAVVGHGSLLTRDVAPGASLVGVPAHRPPRPRPPVPVVRAGRRYPAATDPAPAPALEDALTLLPGEAAVDRRLRQAGEAHLQAVLARTRAAHDGPVLALDEVRDGRIVARRGRYFDMVATADVLRAELEAVGTHEDGSPAGPTPLRDLAERLAGPDPLRNGAGRMAAVGMPVALTVPHGAGRALLLGRRRPDLAMAPGAWHVAPSGMLEPPEAAGVDPIVDTVRRELREEVGPDLSTDEVRAHLSVLGVGYDLHRLRPELCMLLELPEPVQLAPTEAEFDRHALVPLTPDGLARLWAEHPPGRLTEAAAVAVALLERELLRRAG